MSNNEYDLTELHNALLLLLKKFDEICRKYHIQYSIGFGTMLGAIRHKGFIPWDDDVDILITRKEYEKLVKVPASEYGEDFFFQSVKTDPGYPYNTSRLRMNNTSMIYDKWIHAGFNQGIYIDIITLDNVPDSHFAEIIQKISIIFLTPFRFVKNKEVFFAGGTNIPTPLKKVMYQVLSIFPLDKIYQYEVKIETKYAKKQTKRIAFLGEGNLFLKKWYPVQPIPAFSMKKFCYVRFEDTELMCSHEYELLLKQWYGDYMQLPPKEKRQVYHHPRFFSTTVSYLTYLDEVEDHKC